MSADVQFSAPKKVKTRKRSSRPQMSISSSQKQVKTKKKVIAFEAIICTKTFQNFRGRMISHVFTVHNAEKEDIWAFFGVLGGLILLVKREDIFFKRRTNGKPSCKPCRRQKTAKKDLVTNEKQPN